jgi:uncharacterized protein (DUF2267 family)
VYRFAGGHPALDVEGATLADRVRSALGPVQKRLDLPRVHVMAQGQVVLLHGDVGSEDEAGQVELAALEVDGVDGVESYLHVGLVPGDSRPSEGRQQHHVSAALQELDDAARTAGAEEHARTAVEVVLRTLAARLPRETCEHLRSHLPADVGALLVHPRRRGAVSTLRTAAELVVAVLVDHDSAIRPQRAAAIVEAVMGRLRTLVPDERQDVAAVLPEDLRQFWLNAVPG